MIWLTKKLRLRNRWGLLGGQSREVLQSEPRPGYPLGRERSLTVAALIGPSRPSHQTQPARPFDIAPAASVKSQTVRRLAHGAKAGVSVAPARSRKCQTDSQYEYSRSDYRCPGTGPEVETRHHRPDSLFRVGRILHRSEEHTSELQSRQ